MRNYLRTNKPNIADRLEDSDAVVRDASITALGKIGGKSALSVLRHAPPSKVTTVADHNDRSADANTLVAWLRTGDRTARARAATALGQRRGDATVTAAALVSALVDYDYNVREAASTSIKSTHLPSRISTQILHVSHGVAVMPVSQFRHLAKIRATVVLPTPRVPVNK